MTARNTARGSAYWACSDPKCSRKRLRDSHRARHWSRSARSESRRCP